MEKELVDPRTFRGLQLSAQLAFIAAEVQRPELFGAGDKVWWSPEREQASKRRNEVFLQFLAEYTRKLLSRYLRSTGTRRETASVPR
jgi:hypothetical protein